MALFDVEMPTEMIKNIELMSSNVDEMIGKMTEAGARQVIKNVKTNMKSVFKDTTNIEKGLKISKTYKTPSDGGINTKVYFSGYMINKKGKQVPIPLIVNAREYGTSKGEKKKPFFRKSFKQKNVEQAMLEEEKRIEETWGITR